MKGQYDRWLARQQKREEYKSGSNFLYENQLDKLFGGNRFKTQPEQTRQPNLKVGNSYAIVCEDNPDYYRVVFLKQNFMTGSIQSMVSNPTAGVVPPNFQVVSQAQLFQFLNKNQNLQNANKAFPYFDNTKQSEYDKWSNQPTKADVEAANIDRTSGIEEQTTQEETGVEYKARMKSKLMPWNKPNTTKSNVTPDVKARLKAQQDANKAAQQASIKARREKEDSMTPAEKAKRDRENMAKATSSSNKGALGATRSD